MSRRGRIASGKLTSRLIDLARQGIRPQCGNAETSHYWTSEDEQERQLAAAWCDGCIVWAECREAAEANRERWAVWASKDYSIRPGKGSMTRARFIAPGPLT
jgi:Transcription factor WhiB